MFVTVLLAIIALIVTLWQSKETVLSQVKSVLPPGHSEDESRHENTPLQVNDRYVKTPCISMPLGRGGSMACSPH